MYRQKRTFESTGKQPVDSKVLLGQSIEELVRLVIG